MMLAFSRRLVFIVSYVLVGAAALGQTPGSGNQPLNSDGLAKRPRYGINLKLDFDNREFSGIQKFRWTNPSDRSLSVLYFHLYPNVRADYTAVNSGGAPPPLDPDHPRLEVTKVSVAGTETPLHFSFEDQGTTLRVGLREAVLPNRTIELEMEFNGKVPEIDPDETGLTTHVVKQVSAALRGEREIRQGRDINFRSRGVMLLSTFQPVLAVHDGDEWNRRIVPSIGDIVFNDIADYEVTLESDPGIAVFTSGNEKASPATANNVRTFVGTSLRDFALIAGRTLRSEETEVRGTKVRSVFLAEHERVGKRALRVAVDAFRIFSSRFGPLPFETISVVESPLVAGVGSSEFTAFNVIASAYYVDFDAPSMRNLPELIREQRSAVEQSLEWTVAHLMAHQWWGAVVGSDPARQPVLDEALSSWSALLYYRETYGDERAAAVLQDELLGVYRLYRTFGGEDMDANRPARDYRNSFQYEAIVTAKGALMFVELRRLLGDEKLFAALRSYYQANYFEIAQLEDLRAAIIAETPVDQRRTVGRVFTRWLASRRGDEDIARPDPELATSLGLPVRSEPQKGGDRNALTPFARLGKFFWQQMTRIR